MAQPRHSDRLLFFGNRTRSETCLPGTSVVAAVSTCIPKFRRRNGCRYKNNGLATFIVFAVGLGAVGLRTCRRASPAKNSQADDRLIKCDWSNRLGYVAIVLVSLRGDDWTQA